MILKYISGGFTLIALVSIPLSIFMQEKDNKETTDASVPKQSSKLESAVVIIEGLAGLVCLFGVLGYLIVRFGSFEWVRNILTWPAYISYLLAGYIAVGVVGKIVKSPRNSNLSKYEYKAIVSLSYVLVMLDQSKIPYDLLEKASNMPNAILSDLLFASVYICFLFLHVFLSCALLPLPIRVCSNLFLKADESIGKNKSLHTIKSTIFNKYERPLPIPGLLWRVIVKTERKKLLRILAWLFAPVLIVIDVVVLVAEVLISLPLSILKDAIILLQQMRIRARKSIEWLRNISTRRLVALSFRIALIVAFTALVIANRYTPMFRLYEKSTAVFEFVASAILIPMVFEWISEMKNKQNDTNK